MVSGIARVMQRTDPRKCLVTYQGVAKFRRWAAVWENNPRIAQQGEKGDFQELVARDLKNNRPYHLGKETHRWIYNPAFKASPGEIYFTDGERAFGAAHRPCIVIEPTIKAGASPNKQWGAARWAAFISMATAKGLRLTQLGPVGAQVLPGVRHIVTPDFRSACAVLARADAFVGHEGGLHHAAAALGVRGVVIFGGFTPVELTGYDLHRNLGVGFAGGCGMRLPCEHCSKEMAAIPPERVLAELEEIL